MTEVQQSTQTQPFLNFYFSRPEGIEPHRIADVRAMEKTHINGAIELITRTEGVNLLSWEKVQLFNNAIDLFPGFNRVALNQKGQVVGCCFAGHHGARGFLYHLGVDSTIQRNGIGRELVESTYSKFIEHGIFRIQVVVNDSNSTGKSFWSSLGFRMSTKEGGIIVTMTKDLAIPTEV